MIAPKLRFSEFKDEWFDYSVNDFAETVTSGSRDWAKYYSKSGDKFIRMTNLVRKGIYLNLDDLKFVNLPIDSNEGKRTSLQHGDILVSITAELGKIGWIPNDLGTAYINQHTALIRTNDKIDSKFLAYLLSTEKYNNQINGLNDSGAKAGLNLSTLRNFKFVASQDKKEQTKIAEFLSVVDDKISQLSRQLELLKQYKKGVMHKIFSQEIRFKNDNGEDFGEWEKHSLKVLLNKIVDNRGKTPETSLDEKIPLIEVNAIGNKSINYSKILKHVSNETYKTWFRSHIEENDVLFSTVGNTAMCSIFYGEKLACIAQNIVGLRANHQFITGDFLYYLLTEEKNNRLFKSIEMQAVQPSIKVSQMIDLVFNVPTIQEQEKIAEFLTAIDERIDHTTAQLTHTKQWKKGLLQQMFI